MAFNAVSNRGCEFSRFANDVTDHIKKYVIPQYGDAPNDPMSAYTKNDFDTQLKKYITRQLNGGGARGTKEMMRDYLKIAHIAGMCYMMLQQKLQKGE